MIKKKCIPVSILLIITVIMNVNCYLLKQGVYLLKYNNRSENIETLLKKETTTEETKKFLELVQDIRRYAIDSIGLKNNHNYTRYVKLEKDYLIDVVSAAEATSFKQYKWTFPLFGSFPYKGFYEKKDAEKEGRKLSQKGYDINIDEVDAFSTLGIFADPVYSFMSTYSVYGLASLIFHEQTHATVYIKNNSSFSEETATFVGDQGGLNYVKHRYGENSDQYKAIFLAKQDYETYLGLIRSLYHDLKKMYDSNALNAEQKLFEKQRIISEFKKNVSDNYDSLFKTKRFRRITDAKINNAYLAIRMTYTLDLKTFEQLYQKYNYDLRRTVSFLTSLKKSKTDPEEALKKEIAK